MSTVASPPWLAISAVERSSQAPPEFVVRGKHGDHLLVAQWRRRRAELDRPVRLPTHLLSYCAKGAASTVIEIDGEKHHLEPHAGSLVLLRAGHVVRWRVQAADEIVHIHVYIAPTAIEAFHHHHGGHAVRSPMLRDLFDAQDPWLDGYFRMLLCECERFVGREGPAESEFLDRSRDLLFGHLLAAHSEQPCAVRAAPISRVTALRPRLVARIAEHVRSDLSADASLETLAALAALSVGHFSRAFREATGRTPHQFVIDERLGVACEMLRESSTPVAQIARRCGFVNAAHFSSTFHGRYGLSPSRYRQRH